jgi:hypothetical protein
MKISRTVSCNHSISLLSTAGEQELVVPPLTYPIRFQHPQVSELLYESAKLELATHGPGAQGQ